MRRLVSRPPELPVPSSSPHSTPRQSAWTVACEKDGIALPLEGQRLCTAKSEAQAAADALNRRDDYLATISAALEIHMATWLHARVLAEETKALTSEATAAAYLAEQGREMDRLGIAPDDRDAVLDYIDNLPRFTIVEVDVPIVATRSRVA